MITIRAVEPRDAELMYQWRGDEEVMYWGAGNYGDAMITLPQTIEMIQNQRSSDSARHFMIDLTRNGETKSIGNVSFRHFDRICRSVSIGIMIGDKNEWGKGYGTEAIRQFTRLLFTRYNLHRIQLDTFPNNERAIRTYEKCGFVKEGILRQSFWTSDGYSDRVVMGLLVDDWFKLR